MSDGQDYRASSGEWKELNEAVDSSIEQILDELDLMSQTLTTHLELLAADPFADITREDSRTKKFMDELLRIDPNLDIRALILGETQVNASLRGNEFSGIYNVESLVRKLVNDGFVEGGEFVDRQQISAGIYYDDFLKSARRYKSVTEDFFDGQEWETNDLELQIEDRTRYETELRSEEPARIVATLSEYNSELYNKLKSSLPGSRDTRNPYVREVIDEFNNPTKLEELIPRQPVTRPTPFTAARERLASLEVAEELPSSEFEPAFQLPPSDRLDTMGPRPELSPEIKSANARNRILREQRAYDAEVERRTRLEEDMARARMRAQAITPTGPDALEQARLTARNMRVRGRGNARESFEEGMAALRQRPAEPEEKRTFASAEQQRARFEQAMYGVDITADTTPSTENVGEQIQALLDLGLTLDQAVAVLSTTGATEPSGQLSRPTLAETQAADRAEVEEFLRTQFGGFEFFLDKHASDLQVGVILATNQITTADDENADVVKNVLDVIVEQGLTDPSRIEGALKNTKWWQTTDAQARKFDVTYANLTDLERLEYVEPTMDVIREELQFLGAEMSDADRQELAADLMRLGDESDTETVRDMIIERLEGAGTPFDPGGASISKFAAVRDEIEEMSRKYFVPIGTDAAGEYAQKIYLGDWSSEKMEQYFKEHALSKFPTLENAIKNGFTPEEYFAPYKYEIEKMLGRPNISLYDEFSDVIEYFPDVGGENPRPMTLHEVRRYVRGLPEWQESAQGTDSARALAFAIGRTFGEVA